VPVPPRQIVQVGVHTDKPGKWNIHGHNTYHHEGGMGAWILHEG
jgi:FtsP/CotA-like multicopper oxidase with cupredoxin domain